MIVLLPWAVNSFCAGMSSQNQGATETTLLIGDARPLAPGQRRRSVSREPSKFSPETLLIPVAVATKLSTSIPTTTLMELLRQAVCRLWNTAHGNQTTNPHSGPISPDLCDAPQVSRYFATVMAILLATGSMISIASLGILSRVLSQSGRIPVFLFVLIIGIIGSCLIPGSQYVPDWLASWVFSLGMLFAILSGFLPYDYLIHVYIVDVCPPEDRTTALSRIAGWVMLGSCTSYALGGSVTTNTGNPLLVFYISTAILAATFAYIVAILPESFPKERRVELSHLHRESYQDGLPNVTLPGYLSIVYEPLRLFIPTRKLDGIRNWRLSWCGTHVLVFTIACAYTFNGWLVLVMTKHHLTPVDTGVFLTSITVSGAIVLAVVVPLLLRFLRPYYSGRVAHSTSAEESRTGQELEDTSDRLDVHLAFLSCVITACSFLVAAAFPSNRMLVFSGICLGFSHIHGPAIRSLVVGSVDPLKQGEALAAVEMVHNAGTILSSVIMGSILAQTIDTAPLLMFYVRLVVVLISGAPLFLIKDEDRYRKPYQA